MLRMVNVGLGTAPCTQASAKAIAQALHLSFVFAKDIQQISHLYFFYLALFW